MSKFNRICFACKKTITPKRIGNNDLIFIDNKFYHEECFKKLNCICKTCFKCKKEIDLVNEDKVKFQNHFYHLDCFNQLCLKPTQKWKNASKFVEQYISDAEYDTEKLKQKYNMTPSQIKESKLAADREVDKWYTESDLCSFLRQKYNTDKLPYTYLKQVFNGNYKGITKGIPANHLLDMWRRKSNYLDKVYLNNKTKGKDFSTEQRIKYDLAILVSKYDGYLKWLETQKLIEIEPKIENNNLITNDIYISKTDSNQKDLNDVIDDIFDGSDCL